MGAHRHPEVAFTVGVAIDRLMPRVGTGAMAPKRVWWVIGQLDQVHPFLLTYQEPGVAHWTSPVQLGEGVRKKILAKLREEVREASPLPRYLTVHDLTHLSLREADAPTEQLWQQFFDQQWRLGMLNDRDEDWLALEVPFAEKDQAKAAGAKWNARKKTWEGHVSQREAFTPWLAGRV